MTVRGIDDLNAVIAVARLRNFRAAAAHLGMSRSALSHSVATLESRLGARLFHRTTRSVSLTEAGSQFVDAVAPALGDIRVAFETIGAHRETPAGTLRINTSLGAAREAMPLVLDYIARFPDMRIDLVTEGRLTDIVHDGFDAGIRIAEAVPQDMIAVALGPQMQPVVVGAPSYLARHPAPLIPQDLRRHRCIRSRMPSGVIWRWEFERHGQTVAVDVDGALTFDETSLMIEAALAGVGLAYVSFSDVARHLGSGRLIRVLEDWTPSYPGLCLYYPSRRHLSAGMRALVDLVHERRASTGHVNG
jgi:DNA-binding transcriptional LysR family regulator